jgi:hypothetical protein
MGSDDIHEWRKLVQHDSDRFHLYRSDIDDGAAGAEVGPQALDRVRQLADRDSENDQVTATYFNRRSGDRAPRQSAVVGRVIDHEREVGIEMIGNQSTERTEPD